MSKRIANKRAKKQSTPAFDNAEFWYEHSIKLANALFEAENRAHYFEMEYHRLRTCSALMELSDMPSEEAN